jgi:membrane protein GlpM
MNDLRVTALFGIYSLIPYGAYLTSVYWFSYRYNLVWTLSLAAAVWALFALVLLLSWTRYYSVS